MQIKGLMKMKNRIVLLVCLFLMLSATGAMQAGKKTPLRVVPGVDLDRYAGRWYEIARLPNRFQKKCAGEVIANVHTTVRRKYYRVEFLSPGKRKSDSGGGCRATGRQWATELCPESALRSGLSLLSPSGLGRLPDHFALTGLHVCARRRPRQGISLDSFQIAPDG